MPWNTRLDLHIDINASYGRVLMNADGSLLNTPPDMIHGDNLNLRLYFWERGSAPGTLVAVAIPSGAVIHFSAKPAGAPVGSALLFLADSFTEFAEGIHDGALSLNTEELAAHLEESPAGAKRILGEIEITAAGSTRSLQFELNTRPQVYAGEDAPTALPGPEAWLDARAVRFNAAQTLTEPQKLQARQNIDAAVVGGGGADLYLRPFSINAYAYAHANDLYFNVIEMGRYCYQTNSSGDVMFLPDGLEGYIDWDNPSPTIDWALISSGSSYNLPIFPSSLKSFVLYYGHFSAGLMTKDAWEYIIRHVGQQPANFLGDGGYFDASSSFYDLSDTRFMNETAAIINSLIDANWVIIVPQYNSASAPHADHGWVLIDSPLPLYDSRASSIASPEGAATDYYVGQGIEVADDDSGVLYAFYYNGAIGYAYPLGDWTNILAYAPNYPKRYRIGASEFIHTIYNGEYHIAYKPISDP